MQVTHCLIMCLIQAFKLFRCMESPSNFNAVWLRAHAVFVMSSSQSVLGLCMSEWQLAK
jgi:hypothetical protein